MNKLLKSILPVLLLFIVGIFSLQSDIFAAKKISEYRGADGNERIVITFEKLDDIQTFIKGMHKVYAKISHRKNIYLNVRQICFYDFLILEFVNLFYENISDAFKDDETDLIEKVCRIFSQIIIGDPMLVTTESKELVFLNYNIIEKNFRETIRKRMKETESTIYKDRDVFPVKFTLVHEVIL